MPAPTNAELKETNENLKQRLQELKDRHQTDQETMESMKEQMDMLIRQNEELTQQTREAPTNTINVEPTPVAIPNRPTSQPSCVATHKPHVSVPQMEKYDGHGSVTEWWLTFMTFVNLHQMTDINAIRALPFYLKGIALQWFLHLGQECKTSLVVVQDSIFKRFKPKAPVNKEILRVQQAPGESVDQYLYRVRKLAADSTMEESVVTFFAQEGLNDKLRQIVIPQKPATMEELREQASLAETAICTASPPAPINITEAIQEGIQAATSSLGDLVIATVDNRLSKMSFPARQPARPRHGDQSANDNICMRCGGENCTNY
ncbi:hypothetical protein FSP39_016868 [Pinctada imbricata]|uniref:Retrotransposon gag domain-containing protein n=1 Tax=Pinctada imbricata TaxID=66713 RepID=A0AA89C884_PINIB|nr:hypothetical protein FSP39_016868 [Pinctada imbricata]